MAALAEDAPQDAALAARVLAVSVVVPTYRSTEHLDELVEGLDRQTLPQERFEVLLVDDGSPDDTADRLDAFARDRPNYRVFRLPPSGWPSRPRNHGIDEARGEYIVFIDHDDHLFPDALRAAYALATRAGADVLDGKESKSDTPGWAMRDVTEDVENAIGWIAPHPLLPMNPHKMFRTAFLREKGIRFPEGGRQIWEDIAFDIAAHARADVVSLLVETPFYYWNRPEHRTTSGSFHDDLGEYLDAIDRVFGWIDAELSQPRFDELRPRFLAYQLHMRVLPLFFPKERTDADRGRIRAFVSELLPRVSTDADPHLDPWRRLTLALLRAGRFDLVDMHETTLPRLVCVPTANDPRWDAEGLRVDLDLVWRLDSAAGPVVRRVGERAELALHPEVAAYAVAHGLDTDVTVPLAGATYAVDRRSRTEKIDWMLRWVPASDPDAAALAAVGSDDLLAAHTAVEWPLVDDGPGRLHDGPWDLSVRTVVLGTRVVRAVRSDLDAHRWAAVQGRLVAAYRTQNGNLAVDVGQTTVSVLDDAPVAVHRRGHGFTVPLPRVAVFGELDLPGDLVDAHGARVGGCRIVVRAGVAVLEADVPRTAGEFRVVFGGRAARVRFTATPRGRVSVVRASRGGVTALARRAWKRLPASVRRRVWKLRHRR